MPTKEQMETAREQIGDVISRRYIEGNGDLCSCWFQPETPGAIGRTLVKWTLEGIPEPFMEIPRKGQMELLHEFVHWEGFSDAQELTVIQRVLDGEIRDSWMDGLDAVAPDAHLPTLDTIESRPEAEFEHGD